MKCVSLVPHCESIFTVKPQNAENRAKCICMLNHESQIWSISHYLFHRVDYFVFPYWRSYVETETCLKVQIFTWTYVKSIVKIKYLHNSELRTQVWLHFNIAKYTRCVPLSTVLGITIRGPGRTILLNLTKTGMTKTEPGKLEDTDIYLHNDKPSDSIFFWSVLALSTLSGEKHCTKAIQHLTELG